MKALTRAEKQDLLLKLLLTKHTNVTVGEALCWLQVRHNLNGNILDKEV